MDDRDHGVGHILQSLFVNVAIAVVKAGAAAVTGSGAMMAEAIHSFADCGNQVLLLVGVRHAKRPPSPLHPLGHGRSLYFWSFLVALMLFSGGGVASVYEGAHKLMAPEPVTRVFVAFVVLALSLLLEGGATLSNVREMNRRRKGKPFFRYLRDTTDSDLVVVFGENAAAVVGLLVAMGALGLTALTGDPRWDAGGSLVIGVLLIVVALFLATEIQSLLVGEAADPAVADVARRCALETPGVRRVLHVLTLQQGPGEVLLFVKLAFDAGVTVDDASRAINDFEARVRSERPDARWIFVEPDVPRDDPPR